MSCFLLAENLGGMANASYAFLKSSLIEVPEHPLLRSVFDGTAEVGEGEDEVEEGEVEEGEKGKRTTAAHSGASGEARIEVL